MRRTDFDQRSTMEFLLGILIAGLSVIVLPAAADPYQPVRALVAGVAVAVAALVLAVRVPRRTLRLPAVVAAALGAVYVVSAVVNGFPSAVFGVHGRYQGLVAAALYVAAGALGALVLRRAIFALVWPLAGAICLHAVVLVVQRLSGAEATSTIGNPVMAAGWLAVATATVLAAALGSRGVTRLLLIGAALAGALGVGLCGSRGAWVGLALAVIVAAALLKSGRTGAVLGGVAAAVLVGALVLGGPAAASKLDPSALGTGSAASRWQIWRGTATLIGDNPLLGAGPGRFLYVFPRYEPFERAVIEYGDVRVDQAHGEVLQVAAEAGVLAAGLLVALVCIALTRAYRGARARDGASFIALVGLSAAVGQGLFGITTVELGVLGWVLGGVAAAWSSESSGTQTAAISPVKGSKARKGVSAGKGGTAKTAEGLPPRGPLVLTARVALAGAGIAIAAASGVYIAADSAYLRGQELFSAGMLREAAIEHQAAQRVVPWVDNFRVAESDCALYVRGDLLEPALGSLERGLAYEPESYDLALAKARLLRALNRPSVQVAQAYVNSVKLYPLGIEVRAEAVQVLLAAQRPDEAAAMEQDLKRLQDAAEKGTGP